MASAASQDALNKLYPMFYNDLKFVGNPKLEALIVEAIKDAVDLGEAKFQQDFGGWYPPSNKFGINPLRPGHLNKSTNRWNWTSGATSSVHWSASDSFVSEFSLDDNEILLIYGYFNLAPVPNTIEIQLMPGNVKLPVFQLEPMRMKTEPYIIFPQPLLVEPRSPFQVVASCKSTSTSEEAGLLGYFIAPCSTLITREY